MSVPVLVFHAQFPDYHRAVGKQTVHITELQGKNERVLPLGV